MYKELVSDVEGFQHPGHGDLTGWATQGGVCFAYCATTEHLFHW